MHPLRHGAAQKHGSGRLYTYLVPALQVIQSHDHKAAAYRRLQEVPGLATWLNKASPAEAQMVLQLAGGPQPAAPPAPQPAPTLASVLGSNGTRRLAAALNGLARRAGKEAKS